MVLLSRRAATRFRSPFQGFDRVYESFTQGCVAALLALGFIRVPLRGSKPAEAFFDWYVGLFGVD